MLSSGSQRVRRLSWRRVRSMSDGQPPRPGTPVVSPQGGSNNPSTITSSPSVSAAASSRGGTTSPTIPLLPRPPSHGVGSSHCARTFQHDICPPLAGEVALRLDAERRPCADLAVECGDLLVRFAGRVVARSAASCYHDEMQFTRALFSVVRRVTGQTDTQRVTHTFFSFWCMHVFANLTPL